MIKQAEGEYEPKALEARVREYWGRTKAYARTKRVREAGKEYYFCDGPPYTTGSIHLGTALNKVIKDTVVRWLRLHGYNVRDQPGYDMHGLPIEVQVEKTLGVKNKKDIEALGIDKFVGTCRSFATELKDRMSEQFAALGVWLDWEHPYTTIANKYIEVAWWTLKKAHERGLLVEAHRSVNWCPRCETALAEAEVEYADTTDPSVFVKFPLKGRPHESLLIWTTTPWTLPANMAVAVHPQFEYGKVRVGRPGAPDHVWALAQHIPDLMKDAGVSDFEVVDTATGHSMVGWEYEQPFHDQVPYQRVVRGQWVHKVLPSDSVAKEDTGLVHVAPGHGPEDFEIGLRYGIPSFCPVDERGCFTEEAGDYAGRPIRDANLDILASLDARGLLFRQSTVRHRYGHCWRCGAPILFRSTRQWFLKVTELKPKMLEEIQRVKWFPEWAGASRQFEWTANLRDWCISRQRYWGTPLPVWRCESCRDLFVVGSEADLRKGQGYAADMDYHRPAIDQVTFPCGKCGATMRRVPDVIDVWFDAGVCAWAQLVAKPADVERWWPADWICEAHDQTRGWFAAQLAAGLIAFDASPFESVLMHGWMNGPDGLPMSKSKGNYIEPSEVVERHGVDALRLYLLKVNAPWEDVNFQWEEVKNAQRTLNILWNVYRFASTYMEMDRFDPQAFSLEALARFMNPEDKWMLSRVERLKVSVDGEMQAYNLHRAARLLEDFIVDDLSRFYVKVIRGRTWKEGGDRGKLAAYKVLHEGLLAAVKMLAPFCPHITEEVYQGLDGRLLTVHMADWPATSPDWMNAELEAGMAAVQGLVTHLLRLRQKGNMKLRWPLREIAIKGAPDTLARALGQFREVFLEQANAKGLVLLGPDQDFPGMDFVLKPVPEAISHVYKTWWTRIVTMLENRSPLEVKKALERGEFKLGIEGQVIKVDASMVAFEKRVPAGVQVETTPFGELFVDMRVTPEIQAEGYAREVIRRIQQMRKELDLEIEDYVRTGVVARKEVVALLEPWKLAIARETRSRTLTIAEKPVTEEYVVEWNIEGEAVTVGVTPFQMGEALREFSRIRGVDEKKAAVLFDAGYKTLASLQLATEKELVTMVGLSEDEARRIREHFTAPVAGSPCPVCGGFLASGAKRCLRCLRHPGEKVCPHCDAGLWAYQELCDVCGQAVAAQPVPPPLPPPEEAKEEVPRPEAAPIAEAPPAAPVPEPEAQVVEDVPAREAVPAVAPEGSLARAEPAPSDAALPLRESSIYLVLEER
ncbi:MAG TPA: isoleucine--tRNA ligase, partial [Thermoplasmata archaeon]|nr:isoleucine--tRNA ligase [Thermoplasmata archaeon]